MKKTIQNLEIIQQAYKNFGEGKLEAVVTLFHADIEWNECKGFPFVKGNGNYKGVKAVIEDVLSQIPVFYEELNIDVQELFGCDNKVVMVGYSRGIWKETGKKFKANLTHVWTLKEGKIIHFFQAVDTAAIISKMTPAGA